MARQFATHHERFVRFPNHQPSLYAIELSNGLVKVGKCDSPRERMKNHATKYTAAGVRMGRIFIEPVVHRNTCQPEFELLRRLDTLGRRIAPRYETYLDVSFGVAANLVRQIARRELVFYVPTRDYPELAQPIDSSVEAGNPRGDSRLVHAADSFAAA